MWLVGRRALGSWMNVAAAEVCSIRVLPAACACPPDDAPALWRPPPLQGPRQKPGYGSWDLQRQVVPRSMTRDRIMCLNVYTKTWLLMDIWSCLLELRQTSTLTELSTHQNPQLSVLYPPLFSGPFSKVKKVQLNLSYWGVFPPQVASAVFRALWHVFFKFLGDCGSDKYSALIDIPSFCVRVSIECRLHPNTVRVGLSHSLRNHSASNLGACILR